MKTLRVCLSSEIPPVLDRSPDYIYFGYDKLKLYVGQNEITDNYAIANNLPEGQVEGMIYMLIKDGSVHRMFDYVDEKIAEIENPVQIDLLKKAGTIFYVNADHRYLDSQKRSLTLPFNDGVYELNASAKNDAVYDNNTILKFNEDTNRFELYSDTSEDFIDWSKDISGGTTNSTKLDVIDHQIYGHIKLSSQAGNMLRLKSDGLYLKANDIINRREFEEWSEMVDDQKNYVRDTLNNLYSFLQELKNILSEENVQREITVILQETMPQIEEAYYNYQVIAQALMDAENEVVEYATRIFNETYTYLTTKMDIYSGWTDLYEDGTSSNSTSGTMSLGMGRSATPVVDFYSMYLENLATTENETAAAIARAIDLYIEDEENDSDEAGVIAAAVDQYISDEQGGI